MAAGKHATSAAEALAKPGQRVLAYSIDYFVILAIEIGLFWWLPASMLGLDRLRDWTPPALDDPAAVQHAAAALQHALTPAFTALVVAQFVIEIAYFIAAERLSAGRSIGKFLVGLRVVGRDGTAVRTGASVVRNLLRLIDELPVSYLLGFLALLATRRRQRLGDLAARTVVLDERRRRQIPPAREP